jgi:prepilin-type N-terminal cleavage/methylation domain-containing protein
MKTIPFTISRRQNRWLRAFSLVEILCVVVVIGMIAGIVLPSIGPVRTSASQTKLSSDVAVLNRAIALYVAEGGSLDGVTNPLEVIERLKTRTSDADTRRHVGPATGRFVDLRLSGKSSTTSPAASGQPRAVWDPTEKKFVLASEGDGISEFYFDDSKAALAAKEETRKPSDLLYNGNDGWVWENGGTSSSPLAAMTPTTDSVPPSSGSPPSTSFTPSSSNPPSLPSSLNTLPPPTITPASGTFEAVAFPATATIIKNLASGVSSRAVYMIIHSDNTYTPWTTYTAAFALAYGDTVIAYNQSTDAARYVDSVQTRQTYVREPKTLPAPTLTPPGGTYANVLFPLGVTILPNGAPGGAFSKLKYRVTSRAGIVGAWTNYSLPVVVQTYETLEAKNFGVDPTSYYDSASVTGTYTPQISLVDFFTGTVIPKWTDMVGASNLVKTIGNASADDIKATFGQPSDSSSPPNTLEFQRLPLVNIPPDSDFKIGTFSYYNGTVQSGTEASAINLHLDIALTKPGIYAGSANARISLWSSANTSDAKASADYAKLENPKTDFAVVVNGVTYTLQLRFANIKVDEGWTDGTSLFVYEGSNGHADLIGRFVSSY